MCSYELTANGKTAFKHHFHTEKKCCCGECAVKIPVASEAAVKAVKLANEKEDEQKRKAIDVVCQAEYPDSWDIGVLQVEFLGRTASLSVSTQGLEQLIKVVQILLK